MTITFDRPTGTAANLKELEYVSALHQTCFPLRRDGSIDAQDIVHYLSSRHGIVVSTEVVKQHILVELSGELEVEPAYKMDLVEVVALLLIPYLLNHANDDKANRAIQQVLTVMLHETKSSRLSRGFLKTLLDYHGEVEVSQQVLDSMLEAAGGEGTVLDATSLIQALTSDVTKYGIDWGEKLTTHYEDVFSEPPNNEFVNRTGSHEADREGAIAVPITVSHEDEENGTIHSTNGKIGDMTKTQELPFETAWTAPSIDFVADTYRSQTYTVLLWVCMVMVYLAYFWNFDLKWGEVPCNNLGEFGCKIVNGITRWLVIFLELSVLGTAFIFFGSAGNSLFSNIPLAVVRLFIGMATITFATIVSVFVTVTSPVISTEKDDNYYAIYWATFVLGCILLVLQVFSLVRLLFPTEWLARIKPLKIFLTPGIEKMERRTKVAARRKVSAMVETALELHDDPSNMDMTSSRRMTPLGKALLNFQIQPEETESVGGVRWAWKKIIDRSIFEEEGVWLHSRIVACSVAQLFICIFLVVFWIVLFRAALDAVSGSSWESALVGQYVYVWEIVVGATTGIVAALLAVIGIAMVYIPSFISTVLKFRSGVIGSLRDRQFVIYRYAAEQVTVLFGSCFWGCLFTGVAAIILVGGVVFLCVWHVSRSVLITIIAQLIGIGVTVLLRIIILMFLRQQYSAAYYRKQTWKDNFLRVVLESWNLGISTGYMLIRACNLFLVTACYLGRLDTPLLASGVGVVNNIALDSYPNAFRKDILSHDAHRHAYIERLGTMYMMKLRYGDGFGKRSGSCWRVLFVLCLMPWMRKYRLRSISCMDSLDQEIQQIEADLSKEESNDMPERKLNRQETKRRLDRMYNLRNLTQLDGVTSHEERLEREVMLLRERNQQLLEDNRKLHWMMTGDVDNSYRAGMPLQMSSDGADGGAEERIAVTATQSTKD